MPALLVPVTSWCWPDGRSLLVDYGLFQGAEAGPDGAGAKRLAIRFPVEPIQALVITDVHIDHVGRLPYLLSGVDCKATVRIGDYPNPGCSAATKACRLR
ncbi:MAG: MBL fold metallo-hydrolase [Thiohalocapsa sp.]